MPVEWFCNVCRTNRDIARLPAHDGSFAQMLEKLDAKNSSAFRLPGPVRDRFEGVRTGVDGEYEEIANAVKPAPRLVIALLLIPPYHFVIVFSLLTAATGKRRMTRTRPPTSTASATRRAMR